MHETDRLSVKDAATAWFVRLRDEPASDRDRTAFEAWRDADPAHAEAYREIERLWAGLDQIDRRRAGRNGDAGTRTPMTDPASAGRWRALRRMAAAALVAVMAGLGAYGLTGPGLLADHRTGPGEQREIVLADGSAVHLNTTTALSVDITAGRRRVTLHAGEAHFEIATDPARPFVVDAAIGRIEALGTAFSVRRMKGSVEVIVTEKQVAVSGHGQRPAVVTVGESIRITDAGLGAITDADTAATLAWRQGRLVFDNRPLSEVLGELERYRRGRIVILDRAAGAIPVTGSFAVADTDAALKTIEQTLPVRLRRLSDLLILVSAGPAL